MPLSEYKELERILCAGLNDKKMLQKVERQVVELQLSEKTLQEQLRQSRAAAAAGKLSFLDLSPITPLHSSDPILGTNTSDVTSSNLILEAEQLKYEKLEAEFSVCTSMITSLEQELVSLREAAAHAKGQNQLVLDDQLHQAKETMEEMTNSYLIKYEKLEAEYSTSASTISTLEQELKTLRAAAAHADGQNRLEQANMQKLDDELATLQEALLTAQLAFATEHSVKDSALMAVDQANKKLQQSEQREAVVLAELNDAQKDAAGRQKAAAAAHQDEISDLRSALEGAEKEVLCFAYTRLPALCHLIALIVSLDYPHCVT